MSSGITLSAGVRQNLLSLQATADMMATTQNRLATGKKVNSALDNPSNFFTSQSLSDRAGDLNSLLDSIGQAVKTLDAANNGITSLTKLVQSAKSIAQQARSATAPAATYDALSVTGTLPTETIASTIASGANDLSAKAVNLSFTNDAESYGTTGDGAAITVANATTYSFDIDLGAGVQSVSYTSDASATYAEILSGLQSSFATAATNSGLTAGTDVELVANGGGDGIRINSLNYDVDIEITNNNGAGLTNARYDSTSLLDNIVAQGGTAGTSTLELSVTGQDTKTVTFGTAGGQVSTVAELNSWLDSNRGAASASISGTTFSMSLAAGAGNAIGVKATDVGVTAALGLDSATADYNFGTGARGGMGSALTKSFNSDLTLGEIDTDLANGTSISITVNANDGNGAQTQTVGLAGTDDLDSVVAKLKGNASLNANLDITNQAGKLKLVAKTADVDFSIAGGLTTTALNMTAGSYNSTSLLDRIVAAGGAEGDTMTVAANGGAAQTITFGKGVGQVSTISEFTSAINNLSGVSASVTGTAFSVGVAQGTSQTTLTIGGATNTLAAIGTSAQTKSGIKHEGDPNATRESLQKDFNDVLNQIDALSKDASYNGINLLNGDDLKVAFNEDNTSSLTIKGVTLNASNLGLNKQNGTTFQDNAKIDETISAINDALTSLRTQASKFGSNLTTVQTRQDFTKSMVNTLQTGADNLVLADSNEEGANMLALQTRQQLSTTALSLANQANQAVLRLF